jgi:hypothetical protein
VITPAIVMRPTLLVESVVNQTFPSGPAAIPNGNGVGVTPPTGFGSTRNFVSPGPIMVNVVVAVGPLLAVAVIVLAYAAVAVPLYETVTPVDGAVSVVAVRTIWLLGFGAAPRKIVTGFPFASTYGSLTMTLPAASRAATVSACCEATVPWTRGVESASEIALRIPPRVTLTALAWPCAIACVALPLPSACAPAKLPPVGGASYEVKTSVSLPGGAGIGTVHVRGVPVVPPHAGEPDETSTVPVPSTV